MMYATIVLNWISQLSIPGVGACVLVLFVVIFLLYAVLHSHKQSMELRKNNLYLQELISSCKQKIVKIDELEKLIPELQKIARLDHDVNTPLCVITMSLGRAKKLAIDSGDDSLLGNVEDITDAVARIGEIMQAVRVLKSHPLVAQNKAHTSTKEIGQ
jgi:hypothetical protein